jgi:hypothetical protein
MKPARTQVAAAQTKGLLRPSFRQHEELYPISLQNKFSLEKEIGVRKAKSSTQHDRWARYAG